jgi:two-component system, sensor histidine kinase and response regulator
MLDEDRRRCLELGMNESGPKPATPGRPAEATAPSALPGIDMLDALTRLGGNRALLDKVYFDFCRLYVDAAGEIGRLVSSGARGEAAALAHAIKGVAGNIGAKRIYEAAKTLETDLLAGGDGADSLDILRSALAELPRPEPVVPASASAPALSLDRGKFAAAVARLRALLQVRDLDAEESLAALKSLCPEGPLRHRLAELEAAVDALDFDAALRCLALVERDALGSGSE